MGDLIREIDVGDLTRVSALLQEGFPNEPGYWPNVLSTLGSRDRPEGTEKYGYLLEVDGTPRGVILTIPSAHIFEGTPQVFINLSSWYVQGMYRKGRSRRLYASACQRSDVTYTNFSAAAHTIDAITESGFQLWTSGQMGAVVLKAPRRSSPRAKLLDLDEARAEGLPEQDVSVLVDHEKLGCMAACLRTADRLEPLIFHKARVKGFLPAAELVMCRDREVFSKYGRAVTAGLWRRGYALMIVDCSEPQQGFHGKYLPARRVRYFKGKRPNQFVDNSYSELVLLPGLT